jgi:iron(III) transport system ATP-binding protein
MAGISIRGLSKSYGGDADLAAVADLSLDIDDGQFVTLLGPSGCGKTTTLRLIAGFIAPDAGTIHADGRLLSSAGQVVPPEERGMGMVFQNYAVWPHRTVFENVVFGLKLRRVPAAEARERVKRTLALVNLTGLEDRLPGELSGGQQQRVALARSLVVEPEILLLDEPLSNLDAKLRERMRGELKELQRRTGITFVYVTHDQAEALALSDRIAVIHGGRLQQLGTPQEVYARPASRVVADFMGLINLLPATLIDREAGQARLLTAAGWTMLADVPGAAVPGQRVEIAVRPENIRLQAHTGAEPGESGQPDPSQPDQRQQPATVTESTYLGNIMEYHVVLGDGAVLRVQTHPGQQFAIGDKVAVRIDPSRCSVFEVPAADTQEAQGADA